MGAIKQLPGSARMADKGDEKITLKERGLIGADNGDTLLFEQQGKNDVENLSAQLERLTPEQFRIVSDVVYKLMEAFGLGERKD